jgi:predicted GIY-YIG superfamily endonuclease
MYYVYVLMNEYGIVEYVGETQNPNDRISKHKTKPHKNKYGDSFACGKFYGRDDIKMEIVKDFKTKDEAKEFEGQLKIELGFEWTERTRGRNAVNIQHLAKQRELRKQTLLSYRKDTGEFIGEFSSQNEAAMALGVYQANIGLVLSNKRTHTGGYTFKRK